ncbi:MULTISPECIES: FtsX-like permease family protein [unclassified Thioalkalivibrio]|uniref:ABC transporter permease n=1 Tax=unclassified Thioalkalivibrio TaxID=2621013 RepID=UPI00037A6C65|nr:MULTISPECIES: FtsX-like permease family protein [unclassified Thioalkalivibrio]
MRALNRKILRDLGHLKGQAAAIALVIASGVMTLVIAVTSLDALTITKERFYSEYQFADVFAEITRAPESAVERFRDAPGINQIETRVQAPVRLEVAGFDDPIRGTMLSLPDGGEPLLNRLYLREGRLPEPGREREVVLSEAFAEAHGLGSGDALRAIIDGRLTDLQISGIALSPEFVYQISPTDLLPDYERYGILWMNRRALAAAYGMEGAFNSVAVSLQAGADPEPVIEAMDRALARYGGLGAYGREDQFSHRFLSEELTQLRAQAAILPTIFLAVAAFLLNVVVGRIIRSQREPIAVLKAFGYGNGAIAAHYALLTGGIVLVGCGLGLAFGAWAAQGLAGIYAEYFRFPEMSFRLQPWVMVLAVAVAMGAAMLGTFRAVWQAVRMAPAEAMRPPAPELFHRGWMERTAAWRGLDQPTRIILRNLARHRLKSVLSVIGIGLSGGLLLMGAYQLNAVDQMLDTQYGQVLQMDIDLQFTDPVPARVAGELRHEPGVLAVETFRAVPVRLVGVNREERVRLLGLDAEPRLRQLPMAGGRGRLPDEGMLLTDYLAEQLGLRVGDPVELEILEGRRRTVSVPLAGVVEEPIGVGAYMYRPALNRLIGEGPAVSGAWLLTDRAQEGALFARLSDRPRVASVGLIAEAERNIREYIGETIIVFALVFVALAVSIAFAVTYNNARITYAERARDLATLEVLGYSRGQVSWILLGEIAVLTLAAIPVAWLTGTGFAWLLNQAFAMDLLRVPFVITPQAYGFAALGILVAASLTAFLAWRRLQSLDRVQALKAAE